LDEGVQAHGDFGGDHDKGAVFHGGESCDGGNVGEAREDCKPFLKEIKTFVCEAQEAGVPSCAMGTHAKDKSTIGALVSLEVQQYLDERAERAEVVRSRIVRGAVEFWLAMGAPPVNRPESMDTNLPAPPAEIVPPLEPYWAPYLPAKVPANRLAVRT